MKSLACLFVGILCATTALICLGVVTGLVPNQETTDARWWFVMAAAGFMMTSALAFGRVRELRRAIVVAMLAGVMVGCTQAEPQPEQAQPTPQAEQAPAQPSTPALAPEQKVEPAVDEARVKLIRDAFADVSPTETDDSGTRTKGVDTWLCDASLKLHQMSHELGGRYLFDADERTKNEAAWKATGLTREEGERKRSALALAFVNKLGEVANLPAIRREAMSRDWNSCDGTVRIMDVDNLFDTMANEVEHVKASEVSAAVRTAALNNLRERLAQLRDIINNPQASADEQGIAIGAFERLALNALSNWGFSSAQFLMTADVDRLLKRNLPRG